MMPSYVILIPESDPKKIRLLSWVAFGKSSYITRYFRVHIAGPFESLAPNSKKVARQLGIDLSNDASSIFFRFRPYTI